MTANPACSSEGCNRPVVKYKTLMLCNRHYLRQRRGAPAEQPTCSVEGCETPLILGHQVGRCRKHRYVMKTWGVCGVDGCDKRIRADNESGLCGPHLRERKRAEWASERRAKVAALWVEHVDRDRVLVGHAGVCHLCGKTVGPDWQLEHVIPVAGGGPHCYANVAPSHPHCNRVKNRFRAGSPVPEVDAAARKAYADFHGRPFTQ